MAQDTSALEAAVARETTVNESAIVLLARLSQAIKDAGVDPVKLKALTDAIDANAASLAQAVTDNTPAA